MRLGKDWLWFGGLLGLGAVFMIYGFGHARAARTFQKMANEKDAESRQT